MLIVLNLFIGQRGENTWYEFVCDYLLHYASFGQEVLPPIQIAFWYLPVRVGKIPERAQSDKIYLVRHLGLLWLFL
jgi:hypothetical protein